MRFLWLLPLFGSLIGGLFLVDAMLDSAGAPQQAAGAAIAVGFAALPYIFVRAADELNR